MTDATRTNNRQQSHAMTAGADRLEERVEAPHSRRNNSCRPPSALVIDGAEPARRLLRLARDQIAHRCLIIHVQQRLRCVVLDLDIHGSAALELCRTIRAQHESSDVTILLLTAQRSVEAFDVALLAGADELLLKPLSDAELIERVEDALKPGRFACAELRRRCERLCQQRAQLAAEDTRWVSIAG